MNIVDASALDRRRFLKLGSAAAIAGACGSVRAAGVDESGMLYARVVPVSKGLASDWITSLVKAGHARDAALRATKVSGGLAQIGMTVGGIGCGTVYLSGDGRLYVWDIFNQPHEGVVAQTARIPQGQQNIGDAGAVVRERDGSNYIVPPTADRYPGPFRQEFSLDIAGKVWRFCESDWSDVSFDGRWPLGKVEYADAGCPLRVTLSAWTPFIPLQLADSSQPVTVMDYVLENRGAVDVEAKMTGVLENPCGVYSRKSHEVETRTRLIQGGGMTLLAHEVQAKWPAAGERADIEFEDFEQGYGAWKITGNAFGDAPIGKEKVPSYQGDLGMHGDAAVNSHASAAGDGVAAKDAARGTLRSPEFTINRRYIRLLVGGGAHEKRTCVNLIIDGKPVRSVTGKASNRMTPVVIAVAEFEGKQATLEIVDDADRDWGNIGVDHIVFSDSSGESSKIDQMEDFGTMVIGLLGHPATSDQKESLTASVTVPAGKSVCVSFLVAWHFANLHELPKLGRRKAHYSQVHADALAVATSVAHEIDRLRGDTMKWVDTYYDSSMPRWIMDRAMATTSTLQTTNCVILDDKRFWAWEGIGCCEGTCGHVWHYAQGPARLFPEIERNLRAVTDFGVAQNADGAVRFRAESGGIAIDAQAGVVLRTWREHLCSESGEFLRQVWPGVRKAARWLLEFDRKDPDGLDGMLNGEQHNTLDAEWYGKVHALSSMYLGALRAGEEMAKVVGDRSFADECRHAFQLGSVNFSKLFNGEYYEQEEDPRHSQAIGVGKGCYIDQVLGQWWARHAGLGDLTDSKQVKSALHSLWKYNFVPDVGPFRKVFTRGRFYAMPGDAGLIMCTWPRGGLRSDFMKHWQYAYFNECMSGFEWQAATHMIGEGAPVSGSGFESALENPDDPRSLTLRGLAVCRAIHDRYAPAKRNPYNEIECSDHYARAAASYAMLLVCSGFQYDGPRGVIGFAPKLDPEQFRCPFTAAAGWGTFSQKLSAASAWSGSIQVKHGLVDLTEVRLPWIQAGHGARLDGVVLDSQAAPGVVVIHGGKQVRAGQVLEIQ